MRAKRKLTTPKDRKMRTTRLEKTEVNQRREVRARRGKRKGQVRLKN